MSCKGFEQSAVGGIPEFDSAVGARRCDRQSMGRITEIPNVIAVSGKGYKQDAVWVPEFDGIVFASGGEDFAIGRENDFVIEIART